MKAQNILLPLLILLSVSNAMADSNSEATAALKPTIKETFSILNYATGDHSPNEIELQSVSLKRYSGNMRDD